MTSYSSPSPKDISEVLPKALPEASPDLQQQINRLQEQLRQEVQHRQHVEASLRESQICLRLLSSISKSMTAGLEVNEIISVTVMHMGNYFTDRRISHAILDEGQLLRVTAVEPKEFVGFQPIGGSRPPLQISMNDAPDCWRLLHRRQALIVEDIAQELLLKPITAQLMAKDIRSILIVLLQQPTQNLGVLCFDFPQPHVWNSYEVATLTEIVDYLGIVIQEAIAQQERQRADSDRQQAEARMVNSLQEKEILIKEIHHRVKNNLQVISSLLKLQVGHVRDKSTIEALNDSQYRVHAMALVHEKLYQSEDLARTNFTSYAQSLVQDLLRAYGDTTKHIDVQTHVKGIELSLDSTIPCGLIINELLSNALKYAFPYRKSVIEISIYSNKKYSYVLTVQDNGIGLPTHVDIQSASTLGLQLVWSLTQQLLGEIVCTTQPGVGTLFSITFCDRSLTDSSSLINQSES